MVAGAVGLRPQLLGHRQAHAGRDLLGAQEILVRRMLEVLAFERDDALVARRIRSLVDGHGEMAVAEQRARIGRARGHGGGDAGGVETGAGAHLARGGVVDDQHPHRPVALGLQDEAAFEFQRRAQQHGQHDGLAQELGHGDGVVVPREDGVDGGTEAAPRGRAGRAPRPGTAGWCRRRRWPPVRGSGFRVGAGART